MFDNSNIFFSCDLVENNIIQKDWRIEIEKISATYSYNIHLDGKSSTSREPRDSIGVDVKVVDGDTIKNNIPWLFNLYETTLLHIANQHFENKYTIDIETKSAININVLSGVNARYEWHVDSNPLTGLLFVTDHNEQTGGELIFNKKGQIIKVYPKAGNFILFDAREIPHTVAPLKIDTFRISVPMNYYLKNIDRERPENLNAYIYGEKSTN